MKNIQCGNMCIQLLNMKQTLRRKSFVTNVMHVFFNYFKTVYNGAVATLQTCIQEYPLQILAQAPDLLTEVMSFS
jgi:hypothetical protein